MVPEKNNIIIFDGWCNLCGWTVRFIKKHDHSNKFVYVSIQSPEAKELEKRYQVDPEKSDSVIYIENGKAFIKSEAFFRIAKQLGGLYKWLNVFKFIPQTLSDKIYDFIARNRYKWFGKKDSCTMENN